MLKYLMDEVFQELVPILEKIKDEKKIEAIKLTEEIKSKIEVSNNAFEICNWYANDVKVRNVVEEFSNNPNPYIKEFGASVHWLLTKGPYFYLDD